MGELHHIKRDKPRKLGEVAWTEGGLRLSPGRRMVEQDWFWPAMLTFPLGAFLIVFFW
jgi:hypothetical protein